MAKKKKEPKVVGQLGTNGEIAPYNEARVLGRLDDKGNKTAFIQAQKEIAPVRQDSWFKKGALDNSGLDYTSPLDVFNRGVAGVLLSGVDFLGNVGLGITQPIEGIGDFAQNRIADLQETLGDKNGASITRQKAKNQWKVNQDLQQALASDNGMGVDDLSFIGNKGKAIPQGLGSVLLASATGSLGGIASPSLANVASLGTMGVGAAGNAEQEALEQGATRKEARMYGLISGVGETLSEMMFGGLSKGSQVLGIGTGVFDSLDDAVASGLTKKIENKIVKNLIEAGVKATGEGVEEVVSGMFDAVGKKLTYMSDEDIKKLIEDENLLDSFLSGAISAGISQAPGYVQSITTNEGGKVRLQTNEEIRDYITNLNAQEQRVVEQEIQNRINQEEKVSKKRRIEIEKQVIEDLDRGYISANTIRDTLGNNYNAERDTRLNESFNEEARRTQAYENDISKYDEKQAKVIQKAIDSGLLNNSNKTHDFVDLIAKISADKGVDFDFTNNQRINETGFGIKGKTVNGYVKDGVINLNLESNQALNKTVGHEITHVLEGTEVYQELQNSLRSYLGEKEWNNRIKDLSETYKNVENANIENELTSDLVGDYIFNDESFVRNLSTRNQNLFQKIYDEIKYLVKVATAGSKEARELEKVKRAFEKAYRETSKVQEGTQYSVENQTPVEMNINDLTYQSEDYGKYIEENDKGRIDIFKNVLKNKADDNYYGFKYEDIAAPIVVRTEKVDGKYRVYDGQHRLAAYKQLGYETVPVVFKEGNRTKYSITDNQGRKLSQEQQEYFKDSKVRDDKGNLQVVYKAEFGEDNSNVRGFFTKDLDLAKYYQNYFAEEGVYDNKGEIKETYLNIKNPLIIDAQENDYQNIPFEGKEYWSDELVKIAKERNYDGLIIENVLEGDDVYGGFKTTDYVTFNENQAKSIDNTNPTSNPDIRYSLSVQEANTTKDNEGRKLTDNQLAYFKDSKAVDENGNLKILYHGTPQAGYNVIDGHLMLTDNIDIAKDYAGSDILYDTNDPNSNKTPITSRDGKETYWKPAQDIINHLEEYTLNDLNSMFDYVDSNNSMYDSIADFDRTIPIKELRNQIENYQNSTLDEILDYLKEDIIDRNELPIPLYQNEENTYNRREQNRKIYSGYANLVNPLIVDKQGGKVLYNEIQEAQSQGYDGIIAYNTGEGRGNKDGNTYVIFNSNQFKTVDNLNPTDDADIRYQLGNNEVAPTSGWNVRSEDVRLQSAFKEAIAPIQEQVQELSNTINELRDNIAPLRTMTEEEANEYATQTQEAFNNEVAPIRNNLTADETEELTALERLSDNNRLNETNKARMDELQRKENNYVEEEVTPTKSLNDIRDIDEVGARKVKAYQYEHPEVKPYFQEEARILLADLNNTIKGSREGRISTKQGEGFNWEWTGNSRLTSPEIADILDGGLGKDYGYDDIRKGLNAIIEDHGAENIAVAKRIEFILDDRLRNGYDAWGVYDENGEQYHVQPNQEYLNLLRQQEWENYFDDINSQYPLEDNIPQYNFEDEETDFSDVEITPDIQNMTADDINYEPFLEGLKNAADRQAERQQIREELNQKREVNIPRTSDTKRAVNRGLGLLVNEFAAVDDYAKQTGNNNIKFKADTYNNYQAIAQSNIETAQTDINGKKIGRSGNSIFQEAESLGLKDIFDDYLKHWANVDRAKQGKGANYEAQESYKIVKQMEAKNPELKRLGKDMWQYYRNARHNLRDAGIISQEVSDMLGRMYPHYTPYVSENIGNYFTDTGELKPKSTIKRAKGGAILEGLLSAEEAMQMYTKSQFNTIFGNDLYREIVNTSKDIVQLGGDDRGMQFVNADNLYADKDGYYLTAYENGEPITAKISEDMYRTLSRESRNRISDIENTFSLVTKPLQGLSKIRRNILTSWSPTFIAKNFIKDFQEGIFNSKYTKDFIKNYPSAFKELATNTELAQQFKSLYGSGLTMGQYDIDANNYNPSGKNRNFLKGVKNANELIELAPRYAEFKASINNGASLQEAMYNAREVTTNFSRGGTLAKALNRNGFTFLNSSIQGFDKFVRNFSGENGAKGIVNSLAKAVMFGIAPAVFNELAFGTGDDKDEEYEALPDYIKDNYYIIKTGNGNFIRIPKGRVLSVFGSAARRTLEAMQGEENAFEGYFNNVQQQIGINNPEENNIFAPLTQAFGGRKLDSGQTAGSAWYGGDIIPSRLQKERPEDQYDASIDKLSIWLGQHTGISPYKINYVLDQYTGGIGDIGLPMITEEANSDGSIIAPIKDQFTADTVTDNKYVSEFYDTKGKLYTGSKATDEDILKNKYMNSISTEMAKLYAERREVQADESLTKEQKYAKSQAIKAEINRLAKEGMDNYSNVIMSNNYAKIGDTEYYKNANGQWTKVTDDVASLGLDTEEKNEYYKVKNDIYITKKENDGNDKPLVMQDIINSNLTPEAKVNLYTSNYKDDLIQPLVDSGMDVDSYLTYKSQNFTADKDSNGKSISGSKKQKVFDYINSMNIPYEQKLILAKSEYNSFNDNNIEILEYINNSDMSYDEKMTLITKLGFKVDGNNVSW